MPDQVQEQVHDLTVGQQTIRVAYRPGQGRPLLLCNGIGARLELFKPFIDNLDPTIPTVRFDVPGVGGSPLPPRPYRFCSLAHSLGRMLDLLEIDDVDVLGISWGGALAQQFAIQNPRRCKHLVLVSTSTGAIMVPAKPHVLSKMITPQRYRDPQYAASIAATIYGGSVRERPEEVAALLHGGVNTASRRGYTLQLLAGLGWTSVPWLRLVRQPTLVLSGDDDPLIPLVNAKMMASLLPNARLHVFHDGHLGLMTRADELAPMVAEFLREPIRAAA